MTDNHQAVAIVERGIVADRMSPVVMAILQQNPSAETLRELLAVQKEWEQNEARKMFAQALVGLKRDLPTVLTHDKTVHFESSKGTTHYTHVSLATVNEAITGLLSQHGFALTFIPSTSERGVAVKCQLRHAAGHVEESSLAAPLDSSGNKNQVQQIASSITYLKRYLTLSMLGIATSDMPDADEAPAKQDPERVNSKKNLDAVLALKKHGRTKEQAEAFLDRPIGEWTTSDLDQLRLWVRPQPAPLEENTVKQSDELSQVLAGIASASSEVELKTVAPYASKLGDAEKTTAQSAYKAKLATLKAAP